MCVVREMPENGLVVEKNYKHVSYSLLIVRPCIKDSLSLATNSSLIISLPTLLSSKDSK